MGLEVVVRFQEEEFLRHPLPVLGTRVQPEGRQDGDAGRILLSLSNF